MRDSQINLKTSRYDTIKSPQSAEREEEAAGVSSTPQEIRFSDITSIDRHIKNLNTEQFSQANLDVPLCEATNYPSAAFPLSKRQKKVQGKRDTTAEKIFPLLDLFHVRGTILPYLPRPLLFIALWTSLCISILLVKQVAFLENIIPKDNRYLTMTVLSIVIPLLLGYKNNICYNRYWEARSVWAHLEYLSMDMTRIIWFIITSHTPSQIQEKRGAINLVIAFASSTRHYMRNELGIFYNDVCPYISHLKPSFGDREPSARRLSLEISRYLHLYIQKTFRENQLPETILSHTSDIINGMVDCFTSFERIRSTPVPLAYNIHIRQGLYLYVLTLPFQIFSTCGWLSIPMIILVSFTLLGVDFIGYEIQNPFGYSANDLNLDEYFSKIEMELIDIMEMKNCSHPATWAKPYTCPPGKDSS